MNVAILLSGRGSNFVSLSDAIRKKKIPAEIVAVVSNREDAPGLEIARKRGYRTFYIDSRGKQRETFDREVVSVLKETNTEVVCLAGFMRLLSPFFVREFPERILNIHPSLLPAFPGLHAQRQALEWGVKVSGCTVHLVDEHLDHGPIIIQNTVPVLEGEDEASLSLRILEQEHQIYPQALKWVAENRVRVEGRRVHILDAEGDPAESL